MPPPPHLGKISSHRGQVHAPLPPLHSGQVPFSFSQICLPYWCVGSSSLPHRPSAKDLVCQICTLDSSLVHCCAFRVSAKFGNCTVVSVNGTLVEAKLCTFTLESIRVLSSTSVPFTLTTVQVPNLALTWH